MTHRKISELTEDDRNRIFRGMLESMSLNPSPRLMLGVDPASKGGDATGICLRDGDMLTVHTDLGDVTWGAVGGGDGGFAALQAAIDRGEAAVRSGDNQAVIDEIVAFGLKLDCIKGGAPSRAQMAVGEVIEWWGNPAMAGTVVERSDPAGVLKSDRSGILRAALEAPLPVIDIELPVSNAKPAIKGIADVAPVGVFGSYGKRWGL